MQSGWDIALFGDSLLSQAFYARRIADMVSMLIGQLEAQPSLLDPPKSPKLQPTRGGPSVNIQGGIHAGVVNLAQSADGSITQSGPSGPEVSTWA